MMTQEILMSVSNDGLREILLTADGKGRKVKEIALNILLERERRVAECSTSKSELPGKDYLYE